MNDQADELRNLVLESAARQAAYAGPPARIVTVAGGKGGVGTTSLALNLSVALAGQGSQIVLVDADLHRADISALCRLEERYNLGDVLRGHHGIHEVLERGPHGIQVIAGTWAEDGNAICTEFAQRRLIQGLRSMGSHADVVILDVGSGSGVVQQRFWHAADEIIIVTTPDTVSIMDAYAAIKSLLNDGPPVPVSVVVNQVVDHDLAHEVHLRIQRSCRRFLGRDVRHLGHVPLDPRLSLAAHDSQPVMMQSPTCPAARALERIATQLLSPRIDCVVENDDSRLRAA